MATTAITFLTSSQNSNGGWGYNVTHGSNTEATAAVIIAVGNNPAAAEARSRGLGWLNAVQHLDGGWGFTNDDPESSWQTAWALLVLANVDRIASDRAADWLLAVETPEPTQDAIEKMQPLLDIDLTLRGWPWRSAEATWIEPTAWAMVALAATGRQNAPRVLQAVRYITDRRCQNGGWNVGNPSMFSQPFPPRAHPTAWALLALAQVLPSAILPQDIAALRAAMSQDGGALALAWGLLALRALGQEDAAAMTRLSALQQADGSWNANPYHTAVAILAMEGKAL